MYNIDAIFLILLAVCGNFVAETLNCTIQRHLTENMILKSLVIFALIYFTMNFTEKNVVHPISQLKNTFVIWIYFVMIARLNDKYTLAVSVLILLSYVIRNYEKYYENTKQVKLQKQLKKINSWIVIVLIGISIKGFISYLVQKKKQYKKDFDMIKFVFGTQTCGEKNIQKWW